MTTEKSSLTIKGFRFSWMEFSGSFGDLGLFLPLVLAMSLSANLNISLIFIWAGILNIVTGFLFRLQGLGRCCHHGKFNKS